MKSNRGRLAKAVGKPVGFVVIAAGAQLIRSGLIKRPSSATREMHALVPSARRQSPPTPTPRVSNPCLVRRSPPSAAAYQHVIQETMLLCVGTAWQRPRRASNGDGMHEDCQPFTHYWSGRACLGRPQIRYGGNSTKDHANTVICV